jgi:hypothetical protein
VDADVVLGANNLLTVSEYDNAVSGPDGGNLSQIVNRIIGAIRTELHASLDTQSVEVTHTITPSEPNSPTQSALNPGQQSMVLLC